MPLMELILITLPACFAVDLVAAASRGKKCTLEK
jgi:hypothetical protein